MRLCLGQGSAQTSTLACGRLGTRSASDTASSSPSSPHRDERHWQAVGWLVTRLRDDGSYGPEADDLACYYKSPYLFQLSGRTRDAARLLEFIRARFMRPDHDFATSADHKSDNAAFTEYWAYPNGWLAMAAQRMGRFDMAYPAFEYLRSCHEPDRGGFRTSGSSGCNDGGTDALTTAHLGLVCLYFGDVQRAEGAGRWLAQLLARQPDLRAGLFLRLDRSGQALRCFKWVT
jgi:hypothetical protein